MVQAKYVTRDPSRAPALWWYPYGQDYLRLMRTANRALHARSPLTRLLAQLGFARCARFWRRTSPLGLLKNADKLL
jgi:hypothetical protein